MVIREKQWLHWGSDMNRDFAQIEWDLTLEDDLRQLVRLAVREDLDRHMDWTTVALVAEDARGNANVVVRRNGVMAGLVAIDAVLAEIEADIEWQTLVGDSTLVTAGTVVARMAGSARDMLTAERPVLNLLGRLSGIATLTREYVRAVEGTKVRVYDTRKTTPGWRRLEKYAVRCGGGYNHRTGLFDAVLIKDNHLAVASTTATETMSPAAAVRCARRFLTETFGDESRGDMIVEVEVDALEQLNDALAASPDIVLLDNMTPAQLRQAVQIRDAARTDVHAELEASGGVTLDTVRDIAQSGIDRISVGALTHSAVSLDIGLDWNP
jgi:nicotinate-nucleotide pyrophosphorylase (carboxylating)